MLTIMQGTIKEMHALVETGDISLQDVREKYHAASGMECPLDDEKLMIAVAATDDDDDVLLVKNVDIIASGQYVIQ